MSRTTRAWNRDYRTRVGPPVRGDDRDSGVFNRFQRFAYREAANGGWVVKDSRLASRSSRSRSARCSSCGRHEPPLRGPTRKSAALAADRSTPRGAFLPAEGNRVPLSRLFRPRQPVPPGLINAAAPNRFIEGFYDVISLIFHYHYQWNKHDERERNEAVIQEHLTYIEAVLSRNVSSSNSACRAHLTSAKRDADTLNAGARSAIDQNKAAAANDGCRLASLGERHSTRGAKARAARAACVALHVAGVALHVAGEECATFCVLRACPAPSLTLGLATGRGKMFSEMCDKHHTQGRLTCSQRALAVLAGVVSLSSAAVAQGGATRPDPDRREPGTAPSPIPTGSTSGPRPACAISRRVSISSRWTRSGTSTRTMYSRRVWDNSPATEPPIYNDDFTQMTVKLREGIYWSDGSSSASTTWSSRRKPT